MQLNQIMFNTIEFFSQHNSIFSKDRFANITLSIILQMFSLMSLFVRTLQSQGQQKSIYQKSSFQTWPCIRITHETLKDIDAWALYLEVGLVNPGWGPEGPRKIYFEFTPRKELHSEVQFKNTPHIIFIGTPPLEVQDHCTGDSELNLIRHLTEETSAFHPSQSSRVSQSELLLGKTIWQRQPP